MIKSKFKIKSLSIRVQLITSAILFGVLIMAASTFGYISTTRITDASEEQFRQAKLFAAQKELLRFVVDAESGIRGYSQTAEDDFLTAYYEGDKNVGNMIDSLQSQIGRGSPRQSVTLQRIQAIYDNWKRLTALPQIEKVKKLKATTSQKAQDKLETQLAGLAVKSKRITDVIRSEVAKLEAEEEYIIHEQAIRIRDSQRDVFKVLVGTGLVLVLVIVFWLLLIRKSILLPLNHIVSIIKEVASGSMTERIETKFSNEFSLVSAAFNKMLDNLEAARDENDWNTLIIAAARKKYEDLYENAPAMYHTLSAEGLILECNLTEVRELGYARESLVGRKFEDFITPASRDEFARKIQRLKNGENVESEIDIIKADGNIITVRYTAIGVYNGSSEQHWLTNIRETMLDITERKKLEREVTQQNTRLASANRELEKASRLKSEFLATMSHELRTPLNSIIGFSSMLLDARFVDEAMQKTSLEYIMKSGHNLLSLINDILDISKIEAGRMVLNMESVYLDDVITSVAATTSSLLKPDVKLLVEKKGEAPMPTVWGDVARVQQILLNLTSNAAKFTDKGTITIITEQNENSVLISVKDSGIGISEENFKIIFEEFRQVDQTTTRKYEGTGLGLSISQRLARMMGGDITVQSKVGEGSTFTLALTVYDPDKPVRINVPETETHQEAKVEVAEAGAVSTPVPDNELPPPVTNEDGSATKSYGLTTDDLFKD
jgi:PAS domain S-box-containing protein